MAVLTFNGKELKCPSDQKFKGQQGVDGARNASFRTVAQKINRRQVRIDLIWYVASPEELKEILDCIEKFDGVVRYYDPKSGKFINRRMYWGDYEVSTYSTDKDGTPKLFTSLQASLIDMGYPDEG